MTNKEFIKIMEEVEKYHEDIDSVFDKRCDECPLFKYMGEDAKEINCCSLLKFYEGMKNGQK